MPSSILVYEYNQYAHSWLRVGGPQSGLCMAYVPVICGSGEADGRLRHQYPYAASHRTRHGKW